MKKKLITVFLILLVMISQVSIHSQSINVVRTESSINKITFYFKDYFNRENETPFDSSCTVPLLSMVPPTSFQNKFYPVLFFNGLLNQQDALMNWILNWFCCVIFERSNIDWPDEYQDLLEKIKILFPHHLRIVEAYEHTSEQSIQINGDVYFQLYFKSRFGFNKFHNDHVKVSLFTFDPDGLFPVEIANHTVKIQQKTLNRINYQNVILENVQCTVYPETLLLSSVEIFPTNRSVTSKIANPDSILHNTISKISIKLIELIHNSNNYRMKQISEFIKYFQNVSSEFNLTSYDYANLTDAIMGPSLVYDSLFHPSAVIVPLVNYKK